MWTMPLAEVAESVLGRNTFAPTDGGGSGGRPVDRGPVADRGYTPVDQQPAIGMRLW